MTPVTNSGKKLSESELIGAIEANLVQALADFGRLPQVHVHKGPEIMWFSTGIPLPRFNGIVQTRLPSLGIDDAIDEILSHFRSRGTPMVWWTGSSTQPDDLGTRLLRHGLSYAGDTPGMAVELCALGHKWPKPRGLTVSRVNDGTALEDYIQALGRGFGDPACVGRAFFDFFAGLGFSDNLPWRHYVGYLEGMPVACSTMFLGVDVAGIYNVATVPEARRQGIGFAMTTLPLMEARAMGYHIGVLHSSPMGLNVYRKAGFREYCKITSYVWLPAGSQTADDKGEPGYDTQSHARRSMA
jgi:ribosomal protein S18 acetylase RimI-like enzyme